MNWNDRLFLGVCIVVICNLMLAIVMIFLEKKKPQTIIAWLAILTFFPVIGFVFYVMLGSPRVRRMIKQKAISEKDVLSSIKGLKTFSEVSAIRSLAQDEDLLRLCFEMGGTPCLGNDVKIFCHGFEKIAIQSRGRRF